MERLADYIHRVTKLESEGKIGRTKPAANLVEQDSGRDRPRECDASRDRQIGRAHV